MLSYQATREIKNSWIRFNACIWYNRSQMRVHFARLYPLVLALSLFLPSLCNLSPLSASTNRQQIVGNVPAGVDFNEHHTNPVRACGRSIGEGTRVARVTQRQPTHQRFVTCNYYELKAILHAG